MNDPYLSRFLSRIDKTENCWLWTAGRSKSGYGMFRVPPTMRYTHRLSYEHFVGFIPPDLEVMHICNVRHCVFPEHLRVGTHAENMAWMKTSGHAVGPVNNAWNRGRSELLDEAKVYAILGDNRSQSVVAAEYGIAISTVKKIRQRRSWTHVEPPPNFSLRPIGHPTTVKDRVSRT